MSDLFADNRDEHRTIHCLLSAVFPKGLHVLSRRRVYRVGRASESDIALPHRTISREHARIGWNNVRGCFLILHVSGSNATLVNGLPVARSRPLADKDRIEIGPFELCYRTCAGNLQELLGEAGFDTERTVSTGPADPTESRAARPPASLAGSFRDFDLVEICQFLALNGKDGILRIAGAAVSGEIELGGEIEFGAGSIVRAEAGRAAGEDAARALLLLPEGRFAFDNLGGQYRFAAPLLQTQPFLMELCRQLDERQVSDEPTDPGGGGSDADAPDQREGPDTCRFVRPPPSGAQTES